MVGFRRVSGLGSGGLEAQPWFGMSFVLGFLGGPGYLPAKPVVHHLRLFCLHNGPFCGYGGL